MSKTSHQAYVHDKLSEGKGVQIIAESRQCGDVGWVPLEQLHADERVRDARIKSTLPRSDGLLVTALNPVTGLFGVFELVKPDQELDFNSDGHGPADPMTAAREAGEIHAQRVHRTGAFTSAAITAICSGEIKHYEELATAAPSDIDFDAALAMLSQARKPAVDLNIASNGQITLGGKEGMKKSLPCRSTYQVRADVREIDDDGKPNGSLSFRIQEVKSPVEQLPDILRSKRRICASLRTGFDARALGLLHFAKVHEALVDLELQMEYQIAEQRWDIQVIAVLEEQALLAKDRRAQMVFSDW